MNTALIFEKMTQTLAANQDWPLKMAGDTFRIVTAFWPVSLTLRKAGRNVGTITNVQAGDYVKGIQFDEVVVNSAIAQSVTVLIASGGSGSDRISGSVEVVDGGKSRTLSGMAFSTPGAAGVVAAQYAFIALVNPAGSGKNVFLESLLMGSASAQFISGGWLSGSEGSLYSVGSNKNAGGAAGAASVYAGNLAVGPAVTYVVKTYVQASSGVVVNFREPVCIPPGYCFFLGAGSQATDITGDFEYFEESL